MIQSQPDVIYWIHTTFWIWKEEREKGREERSTSHPFAHLFRLPLRSICSSFFFHFNGVLIATRYRKHSLHSFLLLWFYLQYFQYSLLSILIKHKNSFQDTHVFVRVREKWWEIECQAKLWVKIEGRLKCKKGKTLIEERVEELKKRGGKNWGPKSEFPPFYHSKSDFHHHHHHPYSSRPSNFSLLSFFCSLLPFFCSLLHFDWVEFVFSSKSVNYLMQFISFIQFLLLFKLT